MRPSGIIQAEANPIKHMAISGGGAKGAIYSGAIKAAKEEGILDGISAIAGASAGAITAALVATGMQPEDFEELTAETNFEKLLSKGTKKPIGNDGTPLYALLQANIERNVISIFDSDIDEICRKRKDEIAKEDVEMDLAISQAASEKALLEKEYNKVLTEISETKSKKHKKTLTKDTLAKIEQQMNSNNQEIEYLRFKKDTLKSQMLTIDAIENGESPDFRSLKNKYAKIRFRKLQDKAQSDIDLKELDKIKKDLASGLKSIQIQITEGKFPTYKRMLLGKEFNRIEQKLANLVQAENFMKKYHVSLKSLGMTSQDILDGKSMRDQSIANASLVPENQQISFRDLSVLQTLDPKNFKDLYVTAVNKKTGELEIFSPSTTPDVEIALACRASASIPLVFKPVTIEVNGVKQKYVDGGYRDNIPTRQFKETLPPHIRDITGNKVPADSKTLVFAFTSGGESSPLHKALYSSSKRIYTTSAIVKFFVNTLFKKLARVGGKFKYTDTLEQTYKQLRENAHNVVPLDTAGVSTLSFDEATKKAKFLHIRGYVETKIHLRAHNPKASVDDSLLMKSFLLDYCATVDNKSRFKFWRNKIFKEAKKRIANTIIDVCSPEKELEGKLLPESLSKVIENASIDHNGRLSEHTRSMDKLIKILNNSKTSVSVKKSFLSVLGIEPGEDKRLLESKMQDAESFNQTVAKFKFSKDDFKGKIREIANTRRHEHNRTAIQRG